jgi:hypothetical protein
VPGGFFCGHFGLFVCRGSFRIGSLDIGDYGGRGVYRHCEGKVVTLSGGAGGKMSLRGYDWFGVRRASGLSWGYG